MHKLGKDRNANRILSAMEAEGLIQSFRSEVKVYYLTKEGRQLIGSNHQVTKNNQVDHYLMRGDMYIFLGCPKTFRLEFEYRFKGEIESNGITMRKEMFVRPDAYYIKGNESFFIEVDNTQAMNENRKKLERYRILTKHFENSQLKPTIIFYTLSDVRKSKLESYAGEIRINIKVYTKKDIM